MAMDLFAGAAIGAVTGELLKAILDAKKKASNFKSTFERLEATLRSVTAHCNRIQDLNEEFGRPRSEISALLVQLEEGKELIHKCSNVSRWSYAQKIRYSNQIMKLEKSLGRFFNMDMQVEQTRDIKEILKQMTTLSQKLENTIHSGTSGGLPPELLALSHCVQFKARLSLSELAAATNDFSVDNMIDSGGSSKVYWGKLADGREVAVKRAKNTLQDWVFESELACLSRLHHKHLVRLVGYCEEMDERVLVYEYMTNRALYDRLHGEDNVEKNSSIVNSWKMRIKIALEAARGIEYLHNYAVPPIIHRDIKSANILLDAKWTATVTDFGISLIVPEADCSPIGLPLIAGTPGYMDPEYSKSGMITAKSDVYGLGMVLLEVLTGKRVIFEDDSGENGWTRVHIVEYALPAIMAGELGKVLDERVGKPELNEGEAVELVAYTAMHCVSSEGKERPSMTEIVSNLERALVFCEA